MHGGADDTLREFSSIVMLETRPRLFERHLRVARDVHRQAVLIRHAVAAPRRIRPFGSAEHPFELLSGNTDRDNRLAGAATRSPEEVVVVAAYGLRQAVLRAEEVHGPGFAVVTREYAGLRSLPAR